MKRPSPQESVNFDRAAGYYDRSRGYPTAVEAEVTAVLVAALDGRERCLEVGVGTGRIAIPLHRAGVRMVGVDISPRMLEKLLEKSGGRPPFPVGVADATALPFGPGSFGATLAAHVLHLIPHWRAVVAEMARVLGPGGIVLVNLTGGGGELRVALRDRFVVAGGLERTHLGVVDAEELDAAFARMGLRGRDLPAVESRSSVRLEDFIARLERGEHSYAWRMDDPARHRAADSVRAWARERYGSLTEPQPALELIRWRAYEATSPAPH
ncbi:MAG: methyltransferase domain-containing protein [Actinomycetota bacterium]